MNERYDQDKLLGYIEGELPEEERAAFERQLAEDERLHRLIEKLRADREALRDLPTAEPPRDLLEDATFQLERQMLLGEPVEQPAAAPLGGGLKRHMNWSQMLAYGGLAAAVVICAGVMFIALSENNLLQQSQQFAYHAEQDESQEPAAAPVSAAEAQSDTDAPLAVDDAVATEAPSTDAPTDAPQLEQLARLRQPTEADTLSRTMQRELEANVGATAEPDRQMADQTIAANRATAVTPPTDAASPDPAARDDGRREDAEPESTEAPIPEDESEKSDDDVDAPTSLAAIEQPHELTATRAMHARGESSGAAAPSEPAVRIDVVSADPVQTHRDLLVWASDQGTSLRSAETPSTSRPVGRLRAAPETQEAKEAGPAPSQAAGDHQRFAMRLPADQVTELVAHLNRVKTQRATVADGPRTLLGKAVLKASIVAQTTPEQASLDSYVGQNDVLSTPVPTVSEQLDEALAQRFDARHQLMPELARLTGVTPNDPQAMQIEPRTVEVTVHIQSQPSSTEPRLGAEAEQVEADTHEESNDLSAEQKDAASDER